jgi:translation initiation factor IF-3
MFRGREMAHKEIGFQIMKRIVEDLKEHAAPDQEPKMLGRNIVLTFSPVKGHATKHATTTEDEESDPS